MGDRRFDARKTLGAAVELVWQDVSGTLFRQTGVMENLSSSGARIRLDRPIRVEAAVVLSVDGTDVRASARYCLRFGSEFMVGLKFQPDCAGMLRTERHNGEVRLTIRRNPPKEAL